MVAAHKAAEAQQRLPFDFTHENGKLMLSFVFLPVESVMNVGGQKDPVASKKYKAI